MHKPLIFLAFLVLTLWGVPLTTAQDTCTFDAISLNAICSGIERGQGCTSDGDLLDLATVNHISPVAMPLHAPTIRGNVSLPPMKWGQGPGMGDKKRVRTSAHPFI